MNALTEKRGKGPELIEARKETKNALNQSSGKSILAAPKFEM